jgi:hypothetical protein
MFSPLKVTRLGALVVAALLAPPAAAGQGAPHDAALGTVTFLSPAPSPPRSSSITPSPCFTT